MANLDKFKNIGLTENAGSYQFQENFDIGVIAKVDSVIEEASGSSIALIPDIECIHAGLTKNYTFYQAEKLRGNPETHTGIYSWTYPYEKPMLKNHDTSLDPLGRIVEANFASQGLTGQNAVVIRPKLVDADAIEKVKNGTFKTVSIGGSTDSLICSICGTDNIHDACEHWPGQEYDGSVCYFIVGNITFNECSFVNVPADENAMIINLGNEIRSEGVGESTSPQDVVEIQAAENIIQESVNTQTTEEEEPEMELPQDPQPAQEETPVVEDDHYDNQIAELSAKISALEERKTEQDNALIEQIQEAKSIFISAIIQLRKNENADLDENAERDLLMNRRMESLIDSFTDLMRTVKVQPKEEVRVPQTVESTALAASGDTNDVVEESIVTPQKPKPPSFEEKVYGLLQDKRGMKN